MRTISEFRRFFSSFCFWGLIVCGSGAKAAPSEPPPAVPPSEADLPRLLVLGFTTSSGADTGRAEVLGDLVGTHIRGTERYQVITASDIQNMLGVEEQRNLVGCEDDSCFAEISGALGAEYLVTGKLALLGRDQVLTLKLLNSRESRLQNQLADTLPRSESELPEAMRVAAYTLLDLPVPGVRQAWYENSWVWGAAAAVVAGAVVGGVILLSDNSPDEGNLGRVVF